MTWRWAADGSVVLGNRVYGVKKRFGWWAAVCETEAMAGVKNDYGGGGGGDR